MTELLAPAGSLEKLKWAAAYGADAVYFGMQDFSLRNFSSNFTLETAEEGLKFLHKRGKQGYVTMNIYPFSEEYPALLKLAGELADIGADALIVADIGVIHEIKKKGINIPIHVSTQANTLSSQAVLAYKDMGAKRVNLARELSFEKIKEVKNNLKNKEVELEVFVHGAICFAYSGRCSISDYMTGKRANRGECTQSCRWKYSLQEEKRGEYYPVMEDERGTYFFNSKDLALFPYVQNLAKIGIESLKIEGRMKSVHYIASVLSLYRRVLDGVSISEAEGLEELNKLKNRGYSYGFMKGDIAVEDYNIDGKMDGSSTLVVGVTGEKEEENALTVKNNIFPDEELEVLMPGGMISTYRTPKILKKSNGVETEMARNQDLLLLGTKFPPFSLFRRRKITESEKKVEEKMGCSKNSCCEPS